MMWDIPRACLWERGKKAEKKEEDEKGVILVTTSYVEEDPLNWGCVKE